jgi:hypothetical protein
MGDEMRRIWHISSVVDGSLRDSYERTLANVQQRFLSPGYFVGEKRERLYAVAGGIVGIWAALALIGWVLMKI